MAKDANTTRGKGPGRTEKGVASKASSSKKHGTVAKRATGASLTGKAVSRASAIGKLSASRILGPAPGRRTVSDETIREAVRAAIRKLHID